MTTKIQVQQKIRAIKATLAPVVADGTITATNAETLGNQIFMEWLRRETIDLV